MALHDPSPRSRPSISGIEADDASAAVAAMPITLEYLGIGCFVLRATPFDLVDLAYGFSLTERLIDRAGQIAAVDIDQTSHGPTVRVSLEPARHPLADAQRPPAPIDGTACLRALAELADFQMMSHGAGARYAAAACTPGGHIRIVREDAAPHNAFDKLVGAMMSAGEGWEGGFALTSSRGSDELVRKVVTARCPLLATSYPASTLAIDRAAASGLGLWTGASDVPVHTLDPPVRH